MILDPEKKEIIRKILHIEDESTIQAIKRLLNIDDDIPDEHKQILNERIAHYKTNPTDKIDWEAFKKELLKD